MPTQRLLVRGLFCAFVLSGCVANAHNDTPLPPASESAGTVVGLIEVAADANARDPEAAWNEAHHAFESTLEARFVAHYGAQKVATVEYGFSRLHRGLGKAGADKVANQLGTEIAALAANLPVPMVP
ncbi:MAG: hypothetical protein GWP91_13160 [Rhodobacterales bacterium]|nr:hypothetical protein [Rhodobacterales bacterium]